MRKLLFTTVLVCFAGILFAANPIPSYNVLVNGRASFRETVKPTNGNTGQQKERRQMNIQTSTASPSKGITQTFVVATVYRLDGQVHLGPYYLGIGQTISVGIDSSAWGVDVTTQTPVKVSVWASTDLQN